MKRTTKTSTTNKQTKNNINNKSSLGLTHSFNHSMYLLQTVRVHV